jgi:hypothetical protein
LCLVDAVLESKDPLPHMVLSVDHLVDVFQLPVYGPGQIVNVPVERRGDVTKRHAEVAQRDDPVEPAHIVGCVEPMPGLRPSGRVQEPNLIEVVQGTHGESGCVCQLPDPPLSFIHLITHERRYFLTGREVQAFGEAVAAAQAAGGEA